MPPSLTTYSSSPTRSGDGVSGAPRRERPRDVGLRHIAGPIGPDGDQRRLLKAGRDVDQPVAVDRPRHVREAVGVADAPDLLAGRRIVGGRAIRADAHDLIALADADHERRRVGLIARLAAIGLPPDLAGALVERDDETRRRARRS